MTLCVGKKLILEVDTSSFPQIKKKGGERINENVEKQHGGDSGAHAHNFANIGILRGSLLKYIEL